MSYLGGVGVINWVGKPNYDLSWIDSDNLRWNQVESGAVILITEAGDGDPYDGAWLENFTDSNYLVDPTLKDASPQNIQEMSDLWHFHIDESKNRLSLPVLVWSLNDFDANAIISEHTKQGRLTQMDWGVCLDPEYNKAIRDRVKELAPIKYNEYIKEG